MSSEIVIEALEASQTIAVGFVGFTILVWDHAITFEDEVDVIWGGPKNFVTYLFLLNRYLTPIGFIVNLVAYSLPSWTFTKCEHFVRYEGAMVAIATETVGLILLFRVRAMYRKNGYVVSLMVLLWFAWVAVGAWLLSRGEAVLHSSYIHSCRMEFSFSTKGLASAWAWVPLCYDTIVFVLTLNCTLPSMRNKEAGYVVRTLFANGVLFYIVMGAINLVFTIMIAKAPQGLKNITGQLQLILIVTMMSRITLSLRKQARRLTLLAFNKHSESLFPLCFDNQKPVLELLRSSRSSQRENEVLTCSELAGASEHPDDEQC